MSITVLSYHDQALVDQVTAQAYARLEAEKAASSAGNTASADNAFSSVLSAAQSQIALDDTVTANECPEELLPIFEEASSLYGIPVELLTSIARAESNYNPSAVSSAGAIGVMQLMPATAAALNVADPYNAEDNIIGGSKYIAQLLSKYDGNTALALAAYNAGSSNVEKYGGIPPFTETQNYVKKVLSYMNATVNAAEKTVSSTISDTAQTIAEYLSSRNISKDTLDLIVSLLDLIPDSDDDSQESASSGQTTASPQLSVSVQGS